jgi:hypothetical protein
MGRKEKTYKTRALLAGNENESSLLPRDKNKTVSLIKPRQNAGKCNYFVWQYPAV